LQVLVMAATLAAGCEPGRSCEKSGKALKVAVAELNRVIAMSPSQMASEQDCDGISKIAAQIRSTRITLGTVTLGDKQVRNLMNRALFALDEFAAQEDAQVSRCRTTLRHNAELVESVRKNMSGERSNSGFGDPGDGAGLITFNYENVNAKSIEQLGAFNRVIKELRELCYNH
jgi:hypothetical protein